MGTGALANPAAVFASVLHAANLARLVAKKTCPARALVSSARLLETRGAYSASARSRRDAARRRRDVKPARGRRRLESHRRNQTKMGSKQQVPDGMLIGPKNPIIEEALGDRLHYHIKAAKTNLHMRMRRKVRGWLQVLNRATLSSEAPKEKKTISGRTFTRK